MQHKLDEGGTIVMTAEGDAPLDPGQFRESAIAALTEHPGVPLTVDLSGRGRIDAATLAVIVQCWLTTSERACELVVIPGDAADTPVLERLGFDEFYRVADAA